MTLKNTLIKLTALALVTITVALCPASYAATGTSKGSGRMLSPVPESGQTPSVRIRLQIPQLTGDQAINFFSYDHQTYRDSPSFGGGAGGTLHPGPVKIGKRIDCYTPMLHEIHLTGEHLKNVTLRWSRFDPATQTEYLFFTVKLTDVTISAIHTSLPNQYDPVLVNLGEIEEVSFSYAKIEMGCAGA